MTGHVQPLEELQLYASGLEALLAQKVSHVKALEKQVAGITLYIGTFPMDEAIKERLMCGVVNMLNAT